MPTISDSNKSLTITQISIFPLTYLAHVIDEYLGGFPALASKITGLDISNTVFLSVNFFFMGLMLLVIAAILKRSSNNWLLVTLATVIVINSGLHIASSLYLGILVPGIFTGLILWLPFGLWVLKRSYSIVSQSNFAAGVIFGFVAHIFIPLVLALSSVVFAGGGHQA